MRFCFRARGWNLGERVAGILMELGGSILVAGGWFIVSAWLG